MKITSVALLTSSLLGGCAGQIAGPPEETPAEIIGGVTDTGDSSVIVVFAQQNGSNQGSLCTASVIAPTVLLTAAHCVDPSLVGANVTFSAFLGSDLNSNDGAWVPVRETHFDPAFSASNLTGGHDVGIVILASPLSLKALPYSHSSPTGLVGQSVRLVGYGNDSGSTGTGAGKKRQVTTVLDDVSAKLLHIGDSAHDTCQGDSGGPAFMKIGGVETIVGVTSYGQIGCTGGGYDTRVDLYASFIDPFVKAAGSAPPPPASCDWETESNDSSSTAVQLCADGHVNGAIGASGDVDWYTYTAAPNQDYHVSLSMLPADYTMTVYKVSGTSLAVIGTPADNHDRADLGLARHTTTGGTYYVKVSGVNGAFNAQHGYALKVQLQ